MKQSPFSWRFLILWGSMSNKVMLHERYKLNKGNKSEHHLCNVVIFVTESVRDPLEEFNPCVYTFCVSVGDAVGEIIKYWFLPTFKSFVERLPPWSVVKFKSIQ